MFAGRLYGGRLYATKLFHRLVPVIVEPQLPLQRPTFTLTPMVSGMLAIGNSVGAHLEMDGAVSWLEHDLTLPVSAIVKIRSNN